MKKQRTLGLLVILLLLSATGCAVADAAQQPAATEAVARKMAVTETEATESPALPPMTEAPPTASPAEPVPAAAAEPAETAPPATEPAREQPAATENAEQLPQEQALQLALDHLGLSAAEVDRVQVHHEIDDRIPQYDVEFYHGDWEYEFEIHAENGRILSYDKDHKYD